VNNTGTTNYSIALPSTTQGFIAQTDVDSTATGSFQRQNPAAFSNPRSLAVMSSISRAWMLRRLL